MKVFLILTLALFSDLALAGLTGHEKEDYSHRRFIELSHHLLLRRQNVLASLIARQERDLSGCRLIHKGQGGVESLIKCMRFLKTESELSLASPGAKELKADLIVLCAKLAGSGDNAAKFIKSGVLRNLNKDWHDCTRSIWRQIYLTAYAKFDADPVYVVSFVRQAEHGLPADNYWALKLQKLLRTP